MDSYLSEVYALYMRMCDNAYMRMILDSCSLEWIVCEMMCIGCSDDWDSVLSVCDVGAACQTSKGWVGSY